MSNRVRSVLLGIITGVWATNMMVPVFSRGYQPPAELNGVFMAVAGAVVASYAQKKKDDDKDNRQDPPT